MDRYTGYWWSPDDRYVAVERFDEAPVGVVTRAAIGADGTKVYEQRYPAAGTPNVLRRSLRDATRRRANKVKVDLGKRARHLSRPRRLGARRQARCSSSARTATRRVLDMLSGRSGDGQVDLLFSEKSGPKSWINLSNAFHALDDGSLIWWSERDGHGHLYRLQTGKWTQLTKGDWEVAELAGVDEAKGGSSSSATRTACSNGISIRSTSGKPDAVTRLTEAGWWNKRGDGRRGDAG